MEGGSLWIVVTRNEKSSTLGYSRDNAYTVEPN